MKNLFIVKRSVLIHIAVWAILFLLPYIFNPPLEKRDAMYIAFRYYTTCTTAFWMSLFYLNASTLVPRFLYNKKYIFYLLLILICYCVTIGIFWLLFGIIVPEKPNNYLKGITVNFLPFLFTIAVSTTYKTIHDRVSAEAFTTEKQKENLKTELSFLRSQISPHFLFNVLNNILSLIRLKSDEAESTVLKLSSLMQYMLYDTDEEKVLLADEANYLKSYIDLQTQRFGSKVKVNASIDIKDETQAIEPMLLIPFVENAFKHGVGIIAKPEINIQFYTKENTLYFNVHNKYDATNIVKDKTSGIGLANVKRRLELLYRNEHSLIIENDNEIYSIHLQIKLK